MMATIYEVAKIAGVTAATVSNVVTGKGAVSEGTRRRVQAAIAELGYQPNLLARALATSQTYTLSLILPDIANPFYPEIALEVEHTARQCGYSLFLCNTANDESIGRAYLQQLANRRVDGMIVMPGGMALEDLAAATRDGLPVVLCNWEERDELPALPMVGVDFAHAGSLAAAHLLGLGHRRIGVIADVASPHTRHTERVAGFAATLEAAGIAWDPGLLRRGDSSIASGYRAAQALCALPERPTAIFGTNDLMAVGALEGALAMGIEVPAALSIVGVDDIAIASYTHPPLTTVAIPKGRIAAQATSMLLDWIASGVAPSSEPRYLDPALMPRRTTAPIWELPPAAISAPREVRPAEPHRHLLDPPPAPHLAARILSTGATC